MEIECTYIFPDWSNGLKYFCQVAEVTIIEPETRIASFNGIHAAGKTNIDVEGLWISDTQVEHFPRGLSKIFPRLANVHIVECGLKRISKKDFEGLDNLVVLDFNDNVLKSLPNDLFVETPKLRWIYLNYNNIERISSKIFDALNKTNL